MATGATKPRQTAKFARRRSQILDVASGQINFVGTRGMTLTAVARALDLDTSSVTYYFKRKDALAAACLERTLLWMRDVAQHAAGEPDARSRVRAYLSGHFALHRRQREPGVPHLALLSDMRALDDASRAPLDELYAESVRTVREYFGTGTAPGERSRTLLAASALLATVQWLPAWIDRYHVRDFDRVEARLFDILDRGLGGAADWPLAPVVLEETLETGSAGARFLHAATNLINREGYLGASVEKIAAELGVSTGSFYHHLENKDDLVVACFQRTFDVIALAQGSADARGANEAERLAIMVSGLTTLQVAGESPMLRMSAYQALPPNLRDRMLHQTGQATRHVAGTIADGIAEGSLRPVDPVIASQTVMATVNAAADLRGWAAVKSLGEAVPAYGRLLQVGLFSV